MNKLRGVIIRHDCLDLLFDLVLKFLHERECWITLLLETIDLNDWA